MAASETGVAGFVFGMASATSVSFDTAKCTIQGLDYKLSPALETSVKNGNGIVITRRRDDLTERLTCTLKLKSTFTSLVCGATVTIADTVRTELNGAYEVANVGTKLTLGDYAEYAVELIASEGITPA